MYEIYLCHSIETNLETQMDYFYYISLSFYLNIIHFDT